MNSGNISMTQRVGGNYAHTQGASYRAEAQTQEAYLPGGNQA